MDLIDAALRCKKQDGHFTYVGPTYSQAKSTIWQYLKRFTAPIPGVEQRESDLMVRLPNGAHVRLHGADNFERLRGSYSDGLVVDEMGDIDPRAWPEVLRPSLADREGWAVFIGTPKGHNLFHKLHVHAQTDPAWFSLVLKASETGILPQAELDDMRAMMPPESYEAEMQCSFESAILGAYYGRELATAEAEGRIGKVPYDPAIPVHVSFDIGISDSSALWFFQVLRGELHMIDYYEASGYNIAHYAAVLASKPYKYDRIYMPHDAMAREMGTGRTVFETLKSATNHHPYLVPKLSVMDGINAARVTMARCWFDAEHCHDGLEALRAYQAGFDEKNNVFSDRPKHNWASHGSDSFRYASLAWREIAPPKPPPPPRDSWAEAFARSERAGVDDWRVA